MVRYLLEVSSSRKESIDRFFRDSREVFDMFFIPSAPLGRPLLDSLAISIYAKTFFNVDTIFSIRLYDVNLNHIVEKASTADEFGVYGMVLTRGDPPIHGGICGELDSVDVLRYLRSRGFKVRKGLVISLRYTLTAIYNRILENPDFIVIVNFDPSSNDSYLKLKNVVGEASRHGIEAYTYLLLGVGRSRQVFDEIKQPYTTEEGFRDSAEKLEEAGSNIIVSAPGESMKATMVMNAYRKR
jgi:5,10-methylenetetrahydrofolate reductase